MDNNIKLPQLPYGEGTFSIHYGKIRLRKRIKLKNGVYKNLSVTADTPKQCMELMRKKEKEYYEKYTDDGHLSLSDALYNWLELNKKPILKSQSYDRLISVVHNQIEAYDIGMLKYTFVTSLDIQRHINYLNEEKGYSKSVIKKTYDTLNDFYRYKAAQHHIDNPMLLVNMPISSNILAEEKDVDFFDEEDIELFIEEATKITNVRTLKHKYGPALAANIYMGMRIGELLALKWKDIDFNNQTAYVYKTIIQENNPEYDVYDEDKMKKKDIHKVRFVVQNSTKRNKTRYVPLNEKAKNLLRLQMKYSQYTDPEDFVISSSNRNNCNLHNMKGMINRIENYAETKVQNSGTHVLRHTCASLYFRKGVKIEIICAILGNTREVCEKTYVHLINEQLQTEANKIATSYI